MVRYLIAGNSVAAVSAIQAIRQRDKEGEIVVLSPERMTAYCRPLITYILAGDVEEWRLPYKRDAFYQQNNVKVLYGVALEGVDTKKRIAHLSDGQKMAFDKLLLAVGGKPFIPPIENVEGPDVYTYTTVADMNAVRERLDEIKRVVVVGAGMIGMKVAEALKKCGKEVTIVELMDRILPMVLDKQGSALAEKALDRAGVSYVLGDSVVGIHRDASGRVKQVELKSGEKIDCDTVIVAVGVRPNIEPVKDSGISVSKGIVVDDLMETNVEGIYAAGDCAEAYDLILGQKRPNLVWPVAYRQGMIAGTNMAGGRRHYVGGFPINAIGFFGFQVCSAGMSAVEDEANGSFEILRFLDEEKGIYRKVVLGNNRLLGFAVIGDVRRAGLYTGLIWSRMDVSYFKDKLVTDLSLSEAIYPLEGSLPPMNFSVRKDIRRFGWAVFPYSYRKLFTQYSARIEEICFFDEKGVCLYDGDNNKR
ncbi:FAD-dependent pyridine nucleotide-disulfide oxidoreductase [Thermosulfidibacter takaii ABI70S6]|uniref:FAD-dependent pyridine nucleotide-disulfide oxidoreductase n=1 Tax=Thermosulfidibacter takaii (strain DSM 17441 / JCM 13301 / NBRC 103674 / ABI70S6) TaxID=1298851 RepID=A0A0S3QR79_THET7|nr:FAD-dependent oxidoreductase [Thermosulfidibacter takaii]BAT70823.1 FAD-dependent pyridine nucleotide-disulfide oxidoreductase [Thermosulfidibacter takaii ABI70S6]